MATIDQPTPSHPKSPQRDVPPLQPGGPKVSNDNPDPARVNYQSPDSQHEKFNDNPKER
jgi:hypothetical protein